jgi:hypothetical protein
VESKQQRTLVEQIQPAITAYAAAGQRFWRGPEVEPPVDVELLLGLPVVQQELARFDGDVEADLQAGADAIDAAIKSAIASLPKQFSEAALEQFGFTYRDPIATPYGKGDRELRAARALGRTTQRWYDQPNKIYGGVKPRDYVVALVTCALCGVRDPLAFSAEREQGTNDQRVDPRDAPRPSLRLLIARYRWQVVLGLVLLVCAAALAIALGESAQQHIGTPTVSLGAPKRRRGGPSLGEEEVRISLDACTPISGCRTGSSKLPVVARPVDHVTFELHIGDSYSEPITTMKLLASTIAHEGLVEVTITADWTMPLPPGGLASGSSTARVTIGRSRLSVLPSLKYVSGTTQLYRPLAGDTAEEEPSLMLPDGLFSPSGLTLKQIGPQRRCKGCKPITVGSIHFSMQPVATGLTGG